MAKISVRLKHGQELSSSTHSPQIMRLAAKSALMSSNTTTGDLPPSSSVVGVKCLAAAVATMLLT